MNDPSLAIDCPYCEYEISCYVELQQHIADKHKERDSL